MEASDTTPLMPHHRAKIKSKLSFWHPKNRASGENIFHINQMVRLHNDVSLNFES